MLDKPFSQACENNKRPIAKVLRRYFQSSNMVLEIGSGTGQHAIFFAQQLPHLTWQPADRAEYLPGIRLWLESASLPNLESPVELDVNQSDWPTGFDAVFSANTAHIMSWDEAQLMIAKVSALLPKDGIFALYGPFNYSGQFTSDSNRQFDRSLRSVKATQGIRNFEDVVKVASLSGLQLSDDFEMPANNRLLVFIK